MLRGDEPGRGEHRIPGWILSMAGDTRRLSSSDGSKTAAA